MAAQNDQRIFFARMGHLLLSCFMKNIEVMPKVSDELPEPDPRDEAKRPKTEEVLNPPEAKRKRSFSSGIKWISPSKSHSQALSRSQSRSSRRR